MGRTNIEIDEELITRVMRRHGLTTKRAAVDYALRRAAGIELTTDDLHATFGIGWGADLDELRAGDAPPAPW